MENNDIMVNGIEVDRVKAQKLLQKLILREKTNIKTKEKNEGEMVRMIKKMIEEEVECY